MRMNDCTWGAQNEQYNKLNNILTTTTNRTKYIHHYLYDISFYYINKVNDFGSIESQSRYLIV